MTPGAGPGGNSPRGIPGSCVTREDRVLGSGSGHPALLGPLRPTRSSTGPQQMRAGQRDPRAELVGKTPTWGLLRELLERLGAVATWSPRTHEDPATRTRVGHPEHPTLPENCLPHVPPLGFLRKVRQDVEFGRSSPELSGTSEEGSSGLSLLQLQEPLRGKARGLPRTGLK